MLELSRLKTLLFQWTKGESSAAASLAFVQCVYEAQCDRKRRRTRVTTSDGARDAYDFAEALHGVLAAVRARAD